MTFTFSSGSVYTLVQRVLPSGEVDTEFGSVLVPAETFGGFNELAVDSEDRLIVTSPLEFKGFRFLDWMLDTGDLAAAML